MEESFGERRRQEEDRRDLQANRRTYKEFPCAFVYIFQPTKILMLCSQLKLMLTIERNTRGLRDSLAVHFLGNFIIGNRV